MNHIQERMAPGGLTLEGFLGDDPRGLLDILTEDEAAVARLGLTHRQLAARMTELRDRGIGGLGTPVDAGGGLEVVVQSERGGLPCPFGDPGLHAKNLVTVTDSTSGNSISYTDLGIHLIAEHGFYQGRGSRYRLEPANLARILGVAPGV
jgi:hypothetical protein